MKNIIEIAYQIDPISKKAFEYPIHLFIMSYKRDLVYRALVFSCLFFIKKLINESSFEKDTYLSNVLKSSHTACLLLREKHKLYEMETVFRISINWLW